MKSITREFAWDLLNQYVDDKSLLHHSLLVEGTMGYFALKKGEDENYWKVVGLLHDIDFQQWPQEHCVKSQELLSEHGIPDDMIRSIASHGSGLTSVEIQPEKEMEKVLYAIDELTGIIHAAALVRPSKSVMDMNNKSVRKKYKHASFAAGCSRETIKKGADMMGITIEMLIEETLQAMQSFEGNSNK